MRTFILLFSSETKLVKPREELVSLRLAPCRNSIIVQSRLTFIVWSLYDELTTVLSHFVVGNLTASPGVLHTVNEHHVTGGLFHTLKELADIRHNELELMPYLRPDSKAQYTIEFDSNDKPVRVHTIVLSTQHDEFGSDEEMHAKIESDVRNILIPRVIAKLSPTTAALFKGDFILHVNPTGKFVIGGPAGDTGLTGRKIIVDTYGGRSAHGGGAFSGKDPSKVDRSAAYAARYIAKNMVAAGVAEEMMVQIAYAIGVAKPVSVYVNTKGTGIIPDAEIADKIGKMFDLRPAAIIRKFGLKNPIYEPTAAYGHFGRDPYTETVTLWRNGKEVKEEVQFFAWEKLDSVDLIRNEFGL